MGIFTVLWSRETDDLKNSHWPSLTLSTPVTAKPVKLSSTVRCHWLLYRSAIFFLFHTVAGIAVTAHGFVYMKIKEVITCACMAYGGHVLSQRLLGNVDFRFVIFFSFSSSNWRNKHKQSAWDTMSTYSDESDLSGDETFDDIGNFDIVNLPREEINNRERKFGTLTGSSDEWFRFWGIRTKRCSRFRNLGYFYSCINKLCFKFI